MAKKLPLRKQFPAEYNAWQTVRKIAVATNAPVKKSWESFEAFFKDVGPRPSTNHVFRRHRDGGFSKSNTAWVLKPVSAKGLISLRTSWPEPIVSKSTQLPPVIDGVVGLGKVALFTEFKAPELPWTHFVDAAGNKVSFRVIKETNTTELTLPQGQRVLIDDDGLVHITKPDGTVTLVVW